MGKKCVNALNGLSSFLLDLNLAPITDITCVNALNGLSSLSSRKIKFLSPAQKQRIIIASS